MKTLSETAAESPEIKNAIEIIRGLKNRNLRKQVLRYYLDSRQAFSLFDLNRLGGMILRWNFADAGFTQLFVQRWEAVPICGQDESLAQMVNHPAFRAASLEVIGGQLGR